MKLRKVKELIRRDRRRLKAGCGTCDECVGAIKALNRLLSSLKRPR